MALRKLPKPKEKKPKTSHVLDKKLWLLLRPNLRETERKILIFIWLKQREAGGKWTVPIKIADIGENIDRSSSSVKDAIKRLSKKAKCLEKEKGRGRINKYRFIVPAIEIRTQPVRKLDLKKSK